MSPALRVLVLSHMYPRPDSPTNGIFVHEQVRGLRAAGIDARVVSGRPALWDPTRPWRLPERDRTSGRAWATFEDVPFLDFRYTLPRGTWPWVGARRYERGAQAALARLPEAFPFDVIHAHTALVDGSAALRIGEERRRPYLVTEHTGPFSTLLGNRSMRRRTRRALAHAARILPVSEALRAEMLRSVPGLAAGSFETLGNGVDGERFRLRPPRPAAPGAERFEALWVGHMVPVKRLDLLLDALARARRLDPRLHLRLVGSGPLERQVEAMIRERSLGSAVTRHPLAARDEVARHLAECDFLVLSSAVETFGIVVAEALATGLPVLSTRCGGPEDLIVSERFGRLVDGTPEALASGFAVVAENLDRYDPAALRGHVLGRFGSDVIVERLAAIYQEIHGDA